MRAGGLPLAVIALGAMFAVPAQACIEVSDRQFLFSGTAPEVPVPLVAIEGVVVKFADDALTLRLSKAVKGIPAGTEVMLPRTDLGCEHKWGTIDGPVYAIGGFQSFRLPNPVFEAAPLRPLPADIRKYDYRQYIVDPDYVRELEDAANRD